MGLLFWNKEQEPRTVPSVPEAILLTGRAQSHVSILTRPCDRVQHAALVRQGIAG